MTDNDDFLSLIHTEQGGHLIILEYTCICTNQESTKPGLTVVLNSNLDSTTDLREEDYSDKPHPYIEKLLGNASHHPIEKVTQYVEPSVAVHPLPPPLTGVEADLSPVQCQ